MTDDSTEQSREQERARGWQLRRDLLLGAAVVFVLFLIFRHHDGSGNATPTPTPAPTTATTTG